MACGWPWRALRRRARAVVAGSGAGVSGGRRAVGLAPPGPAWPVPARHYLLAPRPRRGRGCSDRLRIAGPGPGPCWLAATWPGTPPDRCQRRPFTCCWCSCRCSACRCCSHVMLPVARTAVNMPRSPEQNRSLPLWPRRALLAAGRWPGWPWSARPPPWPPPLVCWWGPLHHLSYGLRRGPATRWPSLPGRRPVPARPWHCRRGAPVSAPTTWSPPRPGSRVQFPNRSGVNWALTATSTRRGPSTGSGSWSPRDLLGDQDRELLDGSRPNRMATLLDRQEGVLDAGGRG